jgi:four helix bundle protein
MRNFRNLEIWKQGIDIVKEVYKLSYQLPNKEVFGLKSQITRAAVSIPSNIAEGAGRNSNKDFSRFIHFAIGSSFELETQLIIAHEICFIEKDTFYEIMEKLELIQKRLVKFSRYLNS